MEKDMSLHVGNVGGMSDELLISMLEELNECGPDVAAILFEQNGEVVSFDVVPEGSISEQSYWHNWIKPVCHYKEILIQEIKNRLYERDMEILHLREGGGVDA